MDTGVSRAVTKHPTMRVAVTGASGLLGYALIDHLSAHGHAVCAGVHTRSCVWPDGVGVHPLDLTDTDSIRRFIDDARPDCIIHAAAMTDVDRCEREPARATALNASATRRLAEAVAGTQSRIVYVSTDYVFDGTDGPCREDDPPHPINVYGRTKWEGECALRDAGDQHAIVRTAGLLGTGDPDRPSFVDAMADRMRTHPPLPTATDQCANVTPAGYLAEALIEIAERSLRGTWHVAGREIVSRYDLARHLVRICRLPEAAAQAVPYQSLGRLAPRPLKGGLLTERADRELRVQPPALKQALVAWHAAATGSSS